MSGERRLRLRPGDSTKQPRALLTLVPFVVALAVSTFACCSSLAIPPAHAAAPELVSEAHLLASERSLAIAGVATVVASREAKVNAVISFAPGRAPAVIARPAPLGEGSGSTEIAASPTRIAVFQEGVRSGYKGCCAAFSKAVQSAPFGAPLEEQTTGCKPFPGLDESVTEEPGVEDHYAMALDGEVLAYDSFGCVIVDDFSAGLTRTVQLEATLEPVAHRVVWREPTVLAAAGRLIAYRANKFGGEGPAAVVVYDIDSGQSLYSVPVPEAESPTSGVPNDTSFVLQSDGTLVVDETWGKCRATVSSTSEPTPREIDFPVCAVYGLSEGRLLLMTRSTRGAETLAWSSLQSPSPHPLANLGEDGSLQAAAPVLAGGEFVYALDDCWAPRVYRSRLEEPGVPAIPPSACPVDVVGPATASTRGLVVPIRCPLGCNEGTVDVHTGTPAQLRAPGNGTELKLEGTVSVPPEKTVRLSVALPYEESEASERKLRRLIRLLRERRKAYVRLDFKTPTPDAEGRPGEKLTLSHAVVAVRLPGSHRHK
jgi:hypothetical protein